jgi:ABC-type uncharacterized transport system auxiliary subunit
VPLPVQLNVELRAANDLLTKTDMLYQQKPYSLNAYVYDRWAAPPVDLVQAHLLRDLRASGLFEGVFAYRGNLRARFLLTGTLEEFHEVDGAESGHGRLRLTMSLLDLGEHGTEQVLLFQRAYAAEGPEKAQEAGGLAASMSEAMQSVSGNLIADVHSALVKRAAGDS